MCTTFVLCTNIHGAIFLFLHHYMLRTVFVTQADIPRTFHSTRCTMSKFSTPPQCTNTLHVPLTKLLRDNIYPHCVCTNKIPLHPVNTVHITRAIIMHVHTTHTNITHALFNMHCAMINLVCIPAHQYFMCITTLHHCNETHIYTKKIKLLNNFLVEKGVLVMQLCCRLVRKLCNNTSL